MNPQRVWGERRRSCPPACGLLLDLTLALTPALLLRTARRKQSLTRDNHEQYAKWLGLSLVSLGATLFHAI
jgi:hypothetical protein